MNFNFLDLTQEKFNRKDYILCLISYALMFEALGHMLNLAPNSFEVIISTITTLGLIVFFGFVMFIDVKRLKDIGWSTKWVLMRLLVPLMILSIFVAFNFAKLNFGVVVVALNIFSFILGLSHAVYGIALLFVPGKKTESDTK